jgi:hypothetical protein
LIFLSLSQCLCRTGIIRECPAFKHGTCWIQNTRVVWKVHRLAVVHRCYASLCITAAHYRQSTNFSNGPCIIN